MCKLYRTILSANVIRPHRTLHVHAQVRPKCTEPYLSAEHLYSQKKYCSLRGENCLFKAHAESEQLLSMLLYYTVLAAGNSKNCHSQCHSHDHRQQQYSLSHTHLAIITPEFAEGTLTRHESLNCNCDHTGAYSIELNYQGGPAPSTAVAHHPWSVLSLSHRHHILHLTVLWTWLRAQHTHLNFGGLLHSGNLWLTGMNQSRQSRKGICIGMCFPQSMDHFILETGQLLYPPSQLPLLTL